MRKVIVFGLVLVFVFSFVCATDDWGSLNNGDDVGVDNGSEEDGYSQVDLEGASVGQSGLEQEVEGSSEYTQDFYIALGLGFVVVLIVLVVAYFFFRGPRNRWEK